MDSGDRTRRNGWIAAGLTSVALLASVAYTAYLVWVGKLPPSRGPSEPAMQILTESFMATLFSPLALVAGIVFALLYYGHMRLQEAQIERAKLEHESFENE